MSPIKDQKTCGLFLTQNWLISFHLIHSFKLGSCWAFSTVGVLEYWASNKTTAKTILSDQNLLDCETRANDGCNGGNPGAALLYVKESGIASGTKYPYINKQQTCLRTKEPKNAKYASIYKINRVYAGELKGDEATLKAVVAMYGPVIVAIRTQGSGFDNYKSGVFAPSASVCPTSPDSLDHAVVSLKSEA